MIRKLRSISKIMTSSTCKQKFTIHILPDMSRSKKNQAIRFGQLIEYNVRNIFLEKSFTKKRFEIDLHGSFYA